MANRVFQSVIYQMKDAIDRVVGVVDETGAVISCSELNLIGEVREGFMAMGIIFRYAILKLVILCPKH